MQNNINEIKLCIKVNEIETKFTLRYASASRSNVVQSAGGRSRAHTQKKRKNTLTNSYIFYCWSNLICETEGKKKRQVGNKNGAKTTNLNVYGAGGEGKWEMDLKGGNPAEGIYIHAFMYMDKVKWDGRLKSSRTERI